MAKGFLGEDIKPGDKVRVLTTELWAEMEGAVIEEAGKAYFVSKLSGTRYDLETVISRTIKLQ